MSSRTNIPIDKNREGRKKEEYDAVRRLIKERYSNPVYKIGQITDIVARETDPKKVLEIHKKIIVQPLSYDQMKSYGIAPPDTETILVDGYEDITSYTIGVRSGIEYSSAFNIGDIVEVEIVSSEVTKRNYIDGFYSSTLSVTDNGTFQEIRKAVSAAIESPPAQLFVNGFNQAFDSMKKMFSSIDLPDEVLDTRRTVEAYSGGKKTIIEVVTIENNEVEIKTAEKFLEMKKAAAKDNIILKLSTRGDSGFRTMDKQIRIYNNRYDPDYENPHGKKGTLIQGKKPAAYPGYSKHQIGTAIDISTNKATWDEPTPILLWLIANAGNFGFEATLGKDKPLKLQEPWHWVYRG